MGAPFEAGGIKEGDAALIGKSLGVMGAVFLESALVIGASIAVGAVAAIHGMVPIFKGGSALTAISSVCGNGTHLCHL